LRIFSIVLEKKHKGAQKSTDVQSILVALIAPRMSSNWRADVSSASWQETLKQIARGWTMRKTTTTNTPCQLLRNRKFYLAASANRVSWAHCATSTTVGPAT